MDEHQVFTKFCRPRFEALEKHNEEMRADVTAIREKVFNGFGTAIQELKEEIRSLRGWMIGFMGAVVLAILGGLVKLLFF